MSDILQLGESNWRCSHQPPLPSLHSLYEGEVPGDLKLSPGFSPDTLVSCLIKIDSCQLVELCLWYHGPLQVAPYICFQFSFVEMRSRNSLLRRLQVGWYASQNRSLERSRSYSCNLCESENFELLHPEQILFVHFFFLHLSLKKITVCLWWTNIPFTPCAIGVTWWWWRHQ